MILLIVNLLCLPAKPTVKLSVFFKNYDTCLQNDYLLLVSFQQQQNIIEERKRRLAYYGSGATTTPPTTPGAGGESNPSSIRETNVSE